MTDIDWTEALHRLAWYSSRESRLSKWESEFIGKMARRYDSDPGCTGRNYPPTPSQQKKILEIYGTYHGRIAELTGQPR